MDAIYQNTLDEVEQTLIRWNEWMMWGGSARGRTDMTYAVVYDLGDGWYWCEPSPVSSSSSAYRGNWG